MIQKKVTLMTRKKTKLSVAKHYPLSELQLGSLVYLELLKMVGMQWFVYQKDFFLRMSQVFKFSKSQSKQILYELRDQDLLSIRCGRVYIKG